MNLNELFTIQAKLDERIIQEHGLEGQDLLDKKILALQVELGELANEWRGFKFWSKDQEPRKYNIYVGSGVEWKNPLLEEYVDCLHFILSIGLELDYTDESKLMEKWQNGCDEITSQFNFVFWNVAELRNRETISEWDYYYTFGSFLALGDMLEFTTEQIYDAYLNKNKINHQRQESGY